MSARETGEGVTSGLVRVPHEGGPRGFTRAGDPGGTGRANTPTSACAVRGTCRISKWLRRELRGNSPPERPPPRAVVPLEADNAPHREGDRLSLGTAAQEQACQPAEVREVAHHQEVLLCGAHPVRPHPRVVLGSESVTLLDRDPGKEARPHLGRLGGAQLPAVDDPPDPDSCPADDEPRHALGVPPARLRERPPRVLGLRDGLSVLDEIQAHPDPSSSTIERGWLRSSS